MARVGLRRFFGVFFAALFIMASVSGVCEASESLLSGIVFNSQDLEPVGGVELLLENGSESFATLTAEDGSYFFIDIPAGEYTLAINDSDFLSVPIEVVLDASACQSLNLTAIAADILDGLLAAGADRSVSTSVGPKAINTTGKWAGTWKTSTDTGKISMSVRQSGKNLRGKMTVTGTECGTVTLPFTGAISGTSLSIRADGSCLSYPVALVIKKGVLISRTKIKGAFTLLVGNQLYAKGTYLLTRK